jgi:hypothetical protein
MPVFGFPDQSLPVIDERIVQDRVAFANSSVFWQNDEIQLLAICLPSYTVTKTFTYNAFDSVPVHRSGTDFF